MKLVFLSMNSAHIDYVAKIRRRDVRWGLFGYEFSTNINL